MNEDALTHWGLPRQKKKKYLLLKRRDREA
jgi:hypothetical protein